MSASPSLEDSEYILSIRPYSCLSLCLTILFIFPNVCFSSPRDSELSLSVCLFFVCITKSVSQRFKYKYSESRFSICLSVPPFFQFSIRPSIPLSLYPSILYILVCLPVCCLSVSLSFHSLNLF